MNDIPFVLRAERVISPPRPSATGWVYYLCRELTEAMGGHMWVESSGVEGEGPAFYVRLSPLPSAARAEPA